MHTQPAVPEPIAAEGAQSLLITKARLREWYACADGFRWFCETFPSGTATYAEAQEALRAADRREDSGWLANHLAELLLSEPALAAAWAEDFAAAASEWIEQTAPGAIAVPSEGDIAGTNTTDFARIGNSGYGAQIGNSGNDAQIGNSGNGAQIGNSGNDARIGNSGNDARIGNSGYGARINAEGPNAVVVSAGTGTAVRAGELGAIALTWHDGTRARIAVAYVGEGIKADTWYSLNERGEFVEQGELA